MIVLSAGVGVGEQLFVESALIDGLLSIVAAVGGILLIVWWCHYDAQSRHYKTPKLLRLLIVFFALLGVPVYLLITRGRWGILSTIVAGTFLAFACAVEQVAVEATFQLMLLFEWF